MNTYRLLYLFSIAILLLAASCNDDDMPVIDEHTMLRCKINGENWEPACGDLFCIYPFDLQYYKEDRWLNLTAGNASNNSALNGAIVMIVNDARIGENELIDNESLFHIQNHNNDCELYEDLTPTFNSHLSISEIDTIDFFIKGTFEFSAFNECNDTIRVTDGVFDLKYVL